MGFWSDLHQKLLADLASGDWRVKSYAIDTGGISRTTTFQNVEDFLAFLDEVAVRAAQERGEYTSSIEAVPRRS